MDLSQAIGKTIKSERKKAGYTQSELGYRAGCDSMTISRIERGEEGRKPSMELFCIIAEALGQRPSELMGKVEKLTPLIKVIE